jgi:hypothetical protein
MWNTTVTIKTPVTFNASNYPLTYTEQEDVKARYVSKSVRHTNADGTTISANTVVMIENTATIQTNAKIEHDGEEIDIIKINEVYDDRNELDHWEVWTT